MQNSVGFKPKGLVPQRIIFFIHKFHVLGYRVHELSPLDSAFSHLKPSSSCPVTCTTLLHMQYIGESIVMETNAAILTDFSPLIVENCACSCMYLCMYGYNGALLKPVTYIFGMQGFIVHVDRCPVNLNILTPKLEDLEMDPDTQNDDFLENNSNSFDQI
jgi:hypothetical protein